MTIGQAGSVQREPSMEEILASIRRIIEDSDTVRQPGEGSDFAGEKQGVFDADSASPEKEVEAFRAELDEADATPEPLPDFSMKPAAPEGVSPVAEAAEKPKDASAAPAGTFSPKIVRENPAVESPSAPAFFSAAAKPGEPAAKPVTESAEPAETRLVAETKPTIISENTGRQVAAAFGELSEAFAASRRRSFDEMAEEMLRPMLQDWLDNNLPTLVERLVREEIERVARGGQG